MTPSSTSTPAQAVPSSGSLSGANKWIVAVAVMFGTFLAVMDISVINVSLPFMMGSFGQTVSSITWVATAYSIAEIIMATMAGWWSVLLGRKRLYLLSFAVFLAGSILSGTARTFPQMLLYRILQGIGGGSLIPLSQAILRETFPVEEQGIAMALYSMGVVLAPALGPILGGWLTDQYGWPLIFFINVPIGIVGMLVVGAVIHDPPYLRRGVKKVDWGGIALLTLGLTLAQIVLERGQENDWFGSSWIVLGTVLIVVSLAALIWWELQVEEPIVNIRLLRNLPLSLGSFMGLIFGIALYGTTFILPLFTQDLLGYSALDAGLILLPRAMALFLLMPVAGWLYRYVDARELVFFGIGLICWSYYDLAHLSLQISFGSLVPSLLIMGAGMPFMFVTLTTVSLSTVNREDMTEASSLYTLTRRIGGNIGYAVVATLAARRIQFHRVHLTEHITASNPLVQQAQAQTLTLLSHHGLNPANVPPVAHAIVNAVVNRQATMLAYNDVSWLLGLMFLATIPLIFFMPSSKRVGDLP